jgi:hypothetical protein
MGRSNAAAEVRPTIVGGISVIYFRSTVFAQSLIGPPLGFTQTSWQVVGVGGLGFTIQLNPAVAIAPRVEGLVPFARTVDDPESGVYLRWAVNLGWRL